jgi:hypothetical protein
MPTSAVGECPMCVKGSGKPIGHKGRHLTAKVKAMGGIYRV